MSRIVMAAALALAFTLPAVSAQAQSLRTFVSAAGSDSNNCTNVASPCRHFQAAYNAMSNGGEIDVLDPANYGALTVTHELSIVGRGWATLSPVSGASAITINAGSSDTITISGVQLDGAGTTNTNGILFNSGGNLTVTDCVVENFEGAGVSGNGILMRPSSGAVNFIITNSVIANNAYYGFGYQPTQFSFVTANGVIDHVVATSNQQYGIGIDISNGGGATTIAIANSTASNNKTAGMIFVTGSTSLAASIDNTAVSGNVVGIQAFSTVNVLLSRSVIQGNETGISNLTSPNTFYTYGNNLIDLNSSNINPSPLNATVTLR